MKIGNIIISICLLAVSIAQAQTPVIREISQSHGTVNEAITIRGFGFWQFG